MSYGELGASLLPPPQEILDRQKQARQQTAVSPFEAPERLMSVSDTPYGADVGGRNNATDMLGMTEKVLAKLLYKSGLTPQFGRIAGQAQVGGQPQFGQTAGSKPISMVKSPPKDQIQQLAVGYLSRFGWGNQWDALNNLLIRESGWRPDAQNPTSSAFGLFQFLDSTRKNYGIDRNATVEQQIDAGFRYIRDRYGSPEAAWRFWQAHHWY